MTTSRRPKAAKRPIPEPWRMLMEQKGIPSIRRLAERAGLDHMTTTKVVFGDREASERVIQALAGALSIDMASAYRLMGHTASHIEPWAPSACAARMTREQRDIVEDMIYMLVEGHRPVRHTVEGETYPGSHT